MSRQSYFPQSELNSRPSIFISDSNQHHNQRQSFAPGIGNGGNGMVGTTTSASARLQSKKQELEGLLMLKEQSARLVKDIEKLGDNMDALVEGGEAVASVMASWSGVFRAMQIARQSMINKNGGTNDGMEDGKSVPETLVRLPVDAGSQSESQNKQISDEI